MTSDPARVRRPIRRNWRHATGPIPRANAVRIRPDIDSVLLPHPEDESPELTSVVIATHNDGANIQPLLERLRAEPRVAELIVIASACTDDTVPIALELASHDPRIHVYIESERTGKASVVNFGFGVARYPVVLLVAGDVLPDPGAVQLLIDAVLQDGVGLAGGRPRPVDDPASAMGHIAHLMWGVHHRLALHSPKLGEVVAVRAEAVAQLPPTWVDEACLQALVESTGWRSAYMPQAVIRNHGPLSAREFVYQRRRNHVGHLVLKHRLGYTVPSLRPLLLLTEFARHLRSRHDQGRRTPLAWTVLAVTLEMWARLLARTDLVRGKEHHVWAMAASAKGHALGAHGRVARDVQRLAQPGLAAPVADQRDRERNLPL